MVITKINTYKAEIPLTVPFPTSYGDLLPTDHVFIEINDSTGDIGFGEGTALSFFTGETAKGMKSLIDQKYIEPLLGLEVREAIPKFRELASKTHGSPGATAGVEIALLDLYSKSRNIPFYELFGFKVRDEVPAIYAVGATNPAEAAARAEEGVHKGFKFFKLKAHGSIDEDLDRISQVLGVMGPDCKVRIDANCGWANYNKASQILAQLDKMDQIEYVEQPVARENLADLKKLRHEFNTPIFADESCHNPQDAAHLLTNEIVDGLCLKMAKAGGPAQIKLMADMAREFKTNVTMISAFGCSLDERVWISLAGVISNLESALEIGTWWLALDPFTPVRDQTSVAKITDDIGLGITLDKSQLE